MVAAVSAMVNSKQEGGGLHQKPARPPLLPADPDNAIPPRRHKFREVTSRYMSSSSSSSNSSTSSSAASTKRCPSPLVSRTSHSNATAMTPAQSTASVRKRSQSVERRPAGTPRPNNSLDLRGSNGELSAAQKLLLSSTKSLSVSFQGESFSYQSSKVKPTPVRKGTPERKRPMTAKTTPGRGTDQMENSKVERWPARLRQPNLMSRSTDCTDERKRLNGSRNGNVVRALQNSMFDNRDLTAVRSEAHCDPAVSDSESVSSGSTAGALADGSCNGKEEPKPGLRGIIVPARFSQEANIRLRCPNLGSPVSKRIGPDKFRIDSPLSSPKGVVNNRGQSSPIRGPLRPASPSKLGTSSISSPRGMSPSRVRNALGGNMLNTPSVLSFAGDVINMGKIGENKVSDAHLLRLHHNRLLQWRFVNAKADAVWSSQRSNAEKNLYNAWITSSNLRESVRAKRAELQLLRQNVKLISILKGQIIYLDEWALLEHDYCSCLSGATEALMASTLRLPVVAGARADITKLKNAISSAVDVMQAMASSICLLLSKVACISSSMTELRNLSAKEFALLDQCKELLSAIADMQVRECSLRTNILQMNRLPSSLTTKS